MSRVVDVHAHVLVSAAEALLANEPGLAAERAADARGAGAASAAVNRDQMTRLLPALTDPAARLAAMDDAGVDVQLVSPMPLHHYWAGRDLAVKFSALTNEGVLEHCAAAPDRLVGLGTVPLQHPDLAVEVLDRAVADGLRGVEVSTHVAGRELSDESLAAFWARAEALGAVVFVHPWGCTLGERLATAYLSNIVGQPAETTIALSRIVFSGLLDRHPRLKILAGHGGGYLPGYLGRGDHAWRVRPESRTCAHQPSSYLRRMWFDALVYTPDTLRALVTAVGPDRVLLGTDYPFDMGITDPLDRLTHACLPAKAAEAIRSGNARALLGSLPGTQEVPT
ncbi:amidohydrolase family protein [Amycolatopsis thermalba]|uniref:amidohydrolase family protein n=1 Tax=Amycolatopsis thermalba TaxID=944492 RepID=UPI000E279F01|nr:amidohydrolase family protein [Amycolatopsis thermalba]